jgi:hypothetical protein
METYIILDALNHAKKILALLVSPDQSPTSSAALFANCVEAEIKCRKALTILTLPQPTNRRTTP